MTPCQWRCRDAPKPKNSTRLSRDGTWHRGMSQNGFPMFGFDAANLHHVVQKRLGLNQQDPAEIHETLGTIIYHP